MKTMRLKLKQLFCWHEYADRDTHGWYGEPKRGAECLKCEKVSR